MSVARTRAPALAFALGAAALAALLGAAAPGPAGDAASAPAARPAPPAPPAPPATELGPLGDAYRDYLGRALTVGRSTALVRAAAITKGFREASVDDDAKYRPGDRLFFTNAERSAFLVVIGKRSAEHGVRLVGTHHDTPSLQLLPFPLRAPKGDVKYARLLAYGYGGIKSWHYKHRPLAIVGDLRRAADGKRVEVSLGLRADGFAFSVTKLDTTSAVAGAETPKAPEVYEVLAATAHAAGDGLASPVAFGVLRALHDRFGLTEADLGAGTLRVVPSEGPREVGFDRMLVGGWGQDDRLNSFAAARAVIGLAEVPEYTAVAAIMDREEVGSTGSSGMRAEWFERFVARLLEGTGGAPDERTVRLALSRSRALSADTPPAMDPVFPEVHDPENAGRLGHGPVLYKSTGRGGKYGGSDAEPGAVARVRRIFSAAGVPLQTAELGKVDEGGGGTIARFLAERGVEVVDVGAAVVSMHSPMELSHKADLWWTIHGLRAFLASKE